MIDANLRGCLIKQRIARSGRGKSGGYRTVIAYKAGDKAFFIYGFAKNEIANIKREDILRLKEYGSILLQLDEKSLEVAMESKELVEIIEHA